MKRRYLTIIFSLTLSTGFAQKYKPGKSGGGLYSTGGNEVDKGWFFGIGGTYMVAYPKTTYSTSVTDTANNTTQYNFTGDPKGKFGLYFDPVDNVAVEVNADGTFNIY